MAESYSKMMITDFAMSLARSAEDKENSAVLLKLGLSRKFNPVYILIITNVRKKISCEL